MKVVPLNPSLKTFRPGNKVVSYLGESSQVDLPKLGSIRTLQDGTISLYIEHDGEDRVVEIDAKEARFIAEAFDFAALCSEKRVDQISGKEQWVCVGRDGDRVLMRHRGHEDWFRPMKTGKPKPRSSYYDRQGNPTEYRDPRRDCASCRAHIAPGTTAFVIAKREESYFIPTWGGWNDVRLCPKCVEPPPTGLVAVPIPEESDNG